MGSVQSTHTTSEIKEIPQKEGPPPCSVSGRKESTGENSLVETKKISNNEEDTDTDASSDSESEYDSDEEDEEWNERIHILEDAKNLKKLAGFFMHPEKAVETDGTAQARCFFNRPSAPEVSTPEEDMEASKILADARALKKLAMDFLEPARPVEVVPTAFGRNYFTRPSAPTSEEEDERNKILADAQALKKLAVDFLHPERPVTTTDPFATARNYFSRFSAEGVDPEDAAEDREQILADAQALKRLAVDYLHPEKPVSTSDPFATGRNYFTRPSAEEYEDEETMDDRDEILEDMTALKRLAQDYLQPERPVEVDALSSCRNFFMRPSAPSQEDVAEADERAKILADARALKKLAVDYMHPEKPVITTDPCATGRNYFSRPSAEEYEEEGVAEERTQILADMARMKQLAVDYLHPEKPVVTSDGCSMGRNFFTRASAQEYEDDSEERMQVLADALALKKLAVDYLHPEKPVETSDGCAMGRNFFTRASAEEYEDCSEERMQVLADARALKKLAVDYMHPELPVEASDPYMMGRNYFDRASAEGHESHIQTQGQATEKTEIFQAPMDHHDYHDDGYFQYHVDDHVHHDHHDQSDHFDMDEDMAQEFHEFRQSLQAMSPLKGQGPIDEEEEGKLSRSPSSVMLFDEGTAI